MTLNLGPLWVKIPVYYFAVGFMFLGSVLALATPPLINFSNKLSGYIGNRREEEQKSKRGRPTKEEMIAREALLKKEKKTKSKPRVEKVPKRLFKGIPATS